MFDFAKSYGKAVLTSHMTGKKPQDVVNAEMTASIMGIKKTGDYIEDYGNNVILSSMTNISTNDLSKMELTDQIMFGNKK